MSRGAAAVTMALFVVAAMLFSVASAKMDWDSVSYANTNTEKHNILFATSVIIDGKEIPTG